MDDQPGSSDTDGASELTTERLFALCDSNSKGYLTEADLHKACPHLDAQDIVFIFASLDTDGSGRIEKDEFVAGFQNTLCQGEQQGLSGVTRRASIIKRKTNGAEEKARWTQPPTIRCDDEYVYDSESDTGIGRQLSAIDELGPAHEDVLALYEQLQHSGMPQLLRHYEKVVGSFCRELKDHQLHAQTLQHRFNSEKELYDRRLEEVEQELDEQVNAAEQRAREEERNRVAIEKEELREQLESEMRELRENVRKMQRTEVAIEAESQRLEKVRAMRSQLEDVSRENDELRSQMAEHDVELSMIRSELEGVREEAERAREVADALQQQKRSATSALELAALQKQLQLLLDANRKLHETNESLRGTLSSRNAALQQLQAISPTSSCSSLSVSRTSGISPQPPNCGIAEADSSDSDVGGGQLRLPYVAAESPQSRQFSLPPPSNLGPDRTFRIVMCGEAAVGKSSLVVRIVHGRYDARLPSTLGVDFHTKTVVVDNRVVALQLWDTAGQERFRSLCASYFRRADGAILVYDVTSERSYLRVRDWIATIQESTQRRIPLLLIGNKIDLRGNGEIPAAACLSTADGAALAESIGAYFIEASAVTGTNIANGVTALTRDLMAQEDVEVRASSATAVRLEDSKNAAPPSKGCCGGGGASGGNNRKSQQKRPN